MPKAEVEKIAGPCPGCKGYQLLKIEGRTGWFTVAAAKKKLAAQPPADPPADPPTDDDQGDDDQGDGKPPKKGFWD